MAIEEFGGSDAIHEMDLPTPKVGPDFVLMRVRAAALNPVDWKMREGGLEAAFPHIFPLIPGWDAAGVVEQVGPAVTRFRPGDEVFAYCRKHYVGGGTYAEYVSIPESFVAAKPASLDFVQAAAVPLAGLTARQALADVAGVHGGDVVLVHAAAGGVGSFAVQIATALGARVIGTARGDKHGYLRDIGVADAIDYTSVDFVEAVGEIAPDGVDVILDTIGGETLHRSVGALREGGRLVSIAEPPSGERFSARGVQAGYVFVRPDGDDLAALAEAADQEKLRVHLEEVFPLAETARAMDHLEGGRVTGKLALTVD